MRAKHALIALAALLSCFCTAAAQNISPVEAFPKLRFSEPVDLTFIPDEKPLLAVAERKGIVRYFENSRAAAESRVLLDISTRAVSKGQEQGLLGIAFDPDFKKSGYLYVNYTTGNPVVTRIARFKLGGIPLAADPAQEKIILEFAQPYENHNGGQIVFGNDGYLYIASGDGGSGGDPHGNAQSLKTLLGKILRIDVSREEAGNAYAIPKDNPFAGRPDAYPEIFAYGLRNPWRFSFDRKSGELWAGDVGQNAIEEVDLVVKGGNYGWNIMEGTHCFRPKSGCKKDGLIAPVSEYDHKEGLSVIGGFVYRGSRSPALKGRYIFADYVSGKIWALNKPSGGAYVSALLADTENLIVSFGEDQAGELYYLDLKGKIFTF